VTEAIPASASSDQIVAQSISPPTRSYTMIMNEWRIAKTTIETEMLRLAALLSIPSRSATAHAGVARHEVKASNIALQSALKAVAGNL
jgi:hypothetical protein